MKPHRVHGYTDAQRHSMCADKQRYADLSGAQAAALHYIETTVGTTNLYAYCCPMCNGWHLTHKYRSFNVRIIHPELNAIRLIERLVALLWKYQEAA